MKGALAVFAAIMLLASGTRAELVTVPAQQIDPFLIGRIISPYGLTHEIPPNCEVRNDIPIGTSLMTCASRKKDWLSDETVRATGRHFCIYGKTGDIVGVPHVDAGDHKPGSSRERELAQDYCEKLGHDLLQHPERYPLSTDCRITETRGKPPEEMIKANCPAENGWFISAYDSIGNAMTICNMPCPKPEPGADDLCRQSCDPPAAWSGAEHQSD